MRKLDRDETVRCQQRRDSADEIVDVGHVGEHVVGDHQIGRADLVAHALRQRDAEELVDRRHAALARDGGDVGGRIDAEHFDAARE